MPENDKNSMITDEINKRYEEMLENSTAMTTDDIDKVVEYAKKMAEENEDIAHLREIKEGEVDPLDELQATVKEFNLDSDGKPIFIQEAKTLKETDADLMEAINSGIENENDESFTNAFTENAQDVYGLSDEEAAQVLDCILAYRKDKTINVYSALPEKLKGFVNQICLENNMPIAQRNMVAKELITQFIAEAAEDKTFIDFEKALDKAMKIPSLTDLYNEHFNETMDKRLPAMADAIEKEDPEKAAMLRSIAERFTWSVTYSELIEQYESAARIRKSVRKEYDKYNKFAEELNYANRNSRFKINDATSIFSVIKRTIIDNDKDLTNEDAMKFVTLLCRALENRNNDDVLDAAYIYYLLKNIIMLAYTNEDAKGSFSSELISNIKIVMYYVREKESEFNDQYSSTGRKQKSHKASRGTK